MAFFNGLIHEIQPSIMDDIETVLQYVERFNKNDEETDVANAASRIEAYLATYRENDV
jgi:hypothetical protein